MEEGRIFYRRLGPDYDEDAQPLFARDLPVLLREHGFEAGEAEMVGASGVAMVIGTKAGP